MFARTALIQFSDGFATYFASATVFVNIIAVTFLKEKLHWTVILGSTLCIMGVFFVSRPAIIFGDFGESQSGNATACSLAGAVRERSGVCAVYSFAACCTMSQPTTAFGLSAPTPVHRTRPAAASSMIPCTLACRIQGRRCWAWASAGSVLCSILSIQLPRGS